MTKHGRAVAKWPLGRACSMYYSEGESSFEWTSAQQGPESDDMLGLQEILSSCSKLNRDYVSREVLILFKKAEKGKCRPSTCDPHTRVRSPGDVDRMRYGKSDVLELRVLSELEGTPIRLLRVYFAEPKNIDGLLALLFATKPATKDGKRKQDLDMRQAEEIFEEWLDSR